MENVSMYGRSTVHGAVREFFRLVETDEQFCKLSVSLIAKRLQVSVAHLQHLVKSSAGLPCTQVIRNRRVDRAITMLVRFPDKTITEIAFMCNYEPQTMYRHFLTVLGKTPSEIRRRDP
jgi:AraC-like DNA-binding protein